MRDDSACGTIEPTTGILRESSVVYFTRLYTRSFVITLLGASIWQINNILYTLLKHYSLRFQITIVKILNVIILRKIYIQPSGFPY